MPIPKSCGGEVTYGVCLNCHDLKDRQPLNVWNVSELFAAWAGASPISRIVIAKALRIAAEATSALEDANA